MWIKGIPYDLQEGYGKLFVTINALWKDDILMFEQQMKKKILLALLIGAGTIYGSQPAQAADDTQKFSLDPMIVTAQRTEKRDLDTPASVSVITKEEIEKNGATTTMEALRKVAGVTDYSYAPGGDDLGSSYSRVFLRGFDKGALVMVNGAPININNYASVSAIPIISIEKIEVVRGASSVLYGAEALGGVINIITKKGTGELKTTISSTGGNYLGKYSITSQGEGVIISFSKDYVNKFEHAQMDRPSNNTYRVNEKYQKTNIFTSLALSPNLNFTWNYSKIDPMYGQRKLTDNTISGTRYAYNDTKHSASLIYTDINSQTKTILSFNNKKVEANNIATNGKVTVGGDSSNYNASNLYLDTQKKWTLNKKDSLITGLTVKHEKYDQLFADAADNDRNSYGVYASYDKTFNDKFSTTLGLRGEVYRKTTFDEKNNHVFLPQLQTLYKINNTLSWYTNLGKAFEMPAINAHTSSGGTSSDIIKKNAIKPEEGWTYETGLKHITDSSSTKLSIFYMDYKNKFKWKYFDWLPDPKNKIQVNMGKFTNTGLELEYQKNLSPKWDYNLSATIQNPKSYDDDDKKWTQESAKFQLSAGVDYSLNKFTSNLNVLVLTNREESSYRYNGATTTTLCADHNLKNRFLVNSSFKYSPTNNQSFALNLYNILNRHEPVSTYEYYDLPFNWTLTYNYTF